MIFRIERILRRSSTAKWQSALQIRVHAPTSNMPQQPQNSITSTARTIQRRKDSLRPLLLNRSTKRTGMTRTTLRLKGVYHSCHQTHDRNRTNTSTAKPIIVTAGSCHSTPRVRLGVTTTSKMQQARSICVAVGLARRRCRVCQVAVSANTISRGHHSTHR